MHKNKEEHKAAVRKRQNEIRRKLYDYKEENPCVDCGGFFPYYVMDFDHNGDKSFSVSQRSASFGSDLFMAEIAKCDLVCANCHRVRTFNRAILAKLVIAAA